MYTAWHKSKEVFGLQLASTTKAWHIHIHVTCKAYRLGQVHKHCVDGVAYEAEEAAIQAPDDVVIEPADRPDVTQQQALHPKDMIFMLHDDLTCQRPHNWFFKCIRYTACTACTACTSAHQGWLQYSTKAARSRACMQRESHSCCWFGSCC